MKTISFFTDDIAIIPHTATDARHLSRPVTIREFANGEPVALYELENGEYLVKCSQQFGQQDGVPVLRLGPDRFMEGPEA